MYIEREAPEIGHYSWKLLEYPSEEAHRRELRRVLNEEHETMSDLLVQLTLHPDVRFHLTMGEIVMVANTPTRRIWCHVHGHS